MSRALIAALIAVYAIVGAIAATHPAQDFPALAYNIEGGYDENDDCGE